MNPDQILRSIACEQFALVARRQAHDAGLRGRVLRRRIERGDWIPLSPRVMSSGATPLMPLMLAKAALLDVGGDAALARFSAAALWQLPGFELSPVHVVRSRNPGVRTSGLCVVHTSAAFDDRHVTELDGLRVTTPVRTIFDLAATLHPKRTELLLDRAWTRGLLGWETVHRTLDELGASGRAGITLLRELAADRPPDHRPPESNLEARVNELLIEDGQRPLERQVDLGDDIGWIGRVDLLDRECRVIVEVQSDLYHLSLTDQRRDAERKARLEAAGWLVIEISEFVVWHRRRDLLDAVRQARRRGFSAAA
jgi:very-short-patch-repair endonuclease